MTIHIDCETLKEIDNNFKLFKDVQRINLNDDELHLQNAIFENQLGISEEVKND